MTEHEKGDSRGSGLDADTLDAPWPAWLFLNELTHGGRIPGYRMKIEDGCVDDWDDEDMVEDEFEEAMADCGQDGDGFCHLAGTEHCDFVCPFRDAQVED